jgi:uncharacterized protein (TIGR03000 family)
VTVRLPEDARLFIDGVACPLTTDTRSFDTPNLEPGKPYHYTLRAEATRDSKKISQSRQILVQAGKSVEVNFTNLDRVRTASR